MQNFKPSDCESLVSVAASVLVRDTAGATPHYSSAHIARRLYRSEAPSSSTVTQPPHATPSPSPPPPVPPRRGSCHRSPVAGCAACQVPGAGYGETGPPSPPPPTCHPHPLLPPQPIRVTPKPIMYSRYLSHVNCALFGCTSPPSTRVPNKTNANS